MTSEQHPFPPSVLFRSFVLVGGAYVINWLCVFGAGFAVAVFLFPDAFAIMNSEPAEFQRVMEQTPEKIFPPEMLWTVLAINVAVCFGLGFFITRLAPIRPFSHAILLAAVLFAQYLQLAIGADASLRTMLILFMAVSPVAALLGANFSLRRLEQLPTSDGAGNGN